MKGRKEEILIKGKTESIPYHARTVVTKGWCEVRCLLKAVREALTQLMTICFHKVILHLFTADYAITTKEQKEQRYFCLIS